MKKTYEELEKVCCLQISKHPMGICIYKKIDRPRNHDNSDNLCETLRERTRDYNDLNCPRKKEKKKTNTIILTLEFRVSNWTGPHGVTSCPIPN